MVRYTINLLAISFSIIFFYVTALNYWQFPKYENYASAKSALLGTGRGICIQAIEEFQFRENCKFEIDITNAPELIYAYPESRPYDKILIPQGTTISSLTAANVFETFLFNEGSTLCVSNSVIGYEYHMNMFGEVMFGRDSYRFPKARFFLARNFHWLGILVFLLVSQLVVVNVVGRKQLIIISFVCFFLVMSSFLFILFWGQ